MSRCKSGSFRVNRAIHLPSVGGAAEIGFRRHLTFGEL